MNTTINKAIVALLGSLVTLAGVFGLELDWVSDEVIGAAGAILTTLLVYLVPNKKSEEQ